VRRNVKYPPQVDLHREPRQSRHCRQNLRNPLPHPTRNKALSPVKHASQPTNPHLLSRQRKPRFAYGQPTKVRIMPILTKPCKGKLSEQTLQLLRDMQDRSDWGVFPCELCGHSVGVMSVNGEWVPERHWPSVVYTPRRPNLGRYQPKTLVAAKVHSSR
jgi:hypothetical protein